MAVHVKQRTRRRRISKRRERVSIPASREIRVSAHRRSEIGTESVNPNTGKLPEDNTPFYSGIDTWQLSVTLILDPSARYLPLSRLETTLKQPFPQLRPWQKRAFWPWSSKIPFLNIRGRRKLHLTASLSLSLSVVHCNWLWVFQRSAAPKGP